MALKCCQFSFFWSLITIIFVPRIITLINWDNEGEFSVTTRSDKIHNWIWLTNFHVVGPFGIIMLYGGRISYGVLCRGAEENVTLKNL